MGCERPLGCCRRAVTFEITVDSTNSNRISTSDLALALKQLWCNTASRVPGIPIEHMLPPNQSGAALRGELPPPILRQSGDCEKTVA